MTDEAPRRHAVIVAGHKGDAATARAALGDPSAEVRAAALGALARMDQLAPAEVEVAIADPHPGVRRRIAKILASRDDGDLAALLQDPDPTVVEVAAWACGERVGDQGPVGALCAIATDHDDPLCREAAVAALGALEAVDGLPAILKGCSDKPQIRRRAVLALAPFEGPDVDQALEAATTDRDWQVRNAAEALLSID